MLFRYFQFMAQTQSVVPPQIVRVIGKRTPTLSEGPINMNVQFPTFKIHAHKPLPSFLPSFFLSFFSYP